MRTPAFWHQPSMLSTLLSPLGMLYGAASLIAQSTRVPEHADVPVIAVGNAVLGGAGKTPVSLSLGEILLKLGETPHFLSRGYKGNRHTNPQCVNPAKDSFREVGDEPLLLAEIAPCWVHKTRALSARAAHKAQASACIMDDGLQHTSLHRDIAFLVIDTAYGNGNGQIFPAGPLREPFSASLNKAHALVLIGAQPLPWHVPSHIPQFRATLEPDSSWQTLYAKPVIAFAGLARPEKFFHLCTAQGMRVVEQYPFPDHHAYSDSDIDALLVRATRMNATLVTTRKDAVRISAAQRAHIKTLPVHLVWQNQPELESFLKTTLAAVRAGAVS